MDGRRTGSPRGAREQNPAYRRAHPPSPDVTGYRHATVGRTVRRLAVVVRLRQAWVTRARYDLASAYGHSAGFVSLEGLRPGTPSSIPSRRVSAPTPGQHGNEVPNWPAVERLPRGGDAHPDSALFRVREGRCESLGHLVARAPQSFRPSESSPAEAACAPRQQVHSANGMAKAGIGRWRRLTLGARQTRLDWSPSWDPSPFPR